jgi:hypothetical protein
MPSRLPCPRTCKRCGRDYTVLGDVRATAHKTGTCGPCRTAKAREIVNGPDKSEVAIEQAIARGLTGDQVMDRLGVTYQDLWLARRRMEGARV